MVGWCGLCGAVVGDYLFQGGGAGGNWGVLWPPPWPVGAEWSMGAAARVAASIAAWNAVVVVMVSAGELVSMSTSERAIDGSWGGGGGGAPGVL